MIVDAHAHLGTLGSFSASADDLLRWADRAGIEALVVSHFDAIFYDARTGNDATGAAAYAHPDRLVGYVGISSAYYGKAAIEEIDRCVEQYDMRGLKIHSQRVPVGEQSMFPIVEHVDRLGMPVLVHTDATGACILARNVPGATIILAHVGDGHSANMWQAMAMARTQPNVVLDLTCSHIYAGMVEACIRAVGAERVVFGTDLPLLEPEVQIQKLYEARVDEAARRLILADNAARLFRLGEVVGQTR